jgi:ATP-dependent Clp protease adapter protein ClpS
MGEEAAETEALNRENGWIGTEMVRTLSRPLLQQGNPNRVGPIRKPGLDLLEKDKVKTKRPRMWNIVFYNDDYTSMEFVKFVLMKVFHRSRSTEDALSLTLAVHTQGKGIAGTYTFEVAE